MKEIHKYSNPEIVFKNAKEIYGDDIDIRISGKSDKKYMIFNPETKKWVHFGQMGFEDYTKHEDEERKNKFINRNKSWANKPIFSPAFLSYHLLW